MLQDVIVTTKHLIGFLIKEFAENAPAILSLKKEIIILVLNATEMMTVPMDSGVYETAVLEKKKQIVVGGFVKHAKEMGYAKIL